MIGGGFNTGLLVRLLARTECYTEHSTQGILLERGLATISTCDKKRLLLPDSLDSLSHDLAGSHYFATKYVDGI